MFRIFAKALFCAAVCASSAGAAATPDPLAAFAPKRADFRGASAPADVRHIADWALDSGDHEGLPFAVIDKRGARVYVFTPVGRLQGDAPILLGRAIGDDFAPGVVDMEMDETRAWQRVTPAGRFRADEYRKPDGSRILWIDYDSAIALHKVRPIAADEDRLSRIASADPRQRRITYGCINVPVEFYDRVVHPTFNRTDGIVYVLPETRAAQTAFGSYAVASVTSRDAPVVLFRPDRAKAEHLSAPRRDDNAPDPFQRRSWQLLAAPAARQNAVSETADTEG